MADSLSDLAWLWRMSACVSDNRGLRSTWRRFEFLMQAMRSIDALRPFMHPKAGTPLHRLMTKRPETVGAVLWPYQCTEWNATTRLKRIDDHFKIVERMGAPWDLAPGDALSLLDLDELSGGLRVVLDQPQWFMREGQLALNLFAGEVRLFTLAFSFGFDADGITAYVGAIQGGNTTGIQEEYKDLTKSLHGMRPRDFLVELFRTFCRCLDIPRIHAVADAARQHRSKYFGAAKAATLILNYDEIWRERGGVKADDGFFILSCTAPVRNLDDVPSKKRAMYRRRYELLFELENKLRSMTRAGCKVGACPA